MQVPTQFNVNSIQCELFKKCEHSGWKLYDPVAEYGRMGVFINIDVK
jgi:hypothetical protein